MRYPLITLLVTSLGVISAGDGVAETQASKAASSRDAQSIRDRIRNNVVASLRPQQRERFRQGWDRTYEEGIQHALANRFHEISYIVLEQSEHGALRPAEIGASERNSLEFIIKSELNDKKAADAFVSWVEEFGNIAVYASWQAAYHAVAQAIEGKLLEDHKARYGRVNDSIRYVIEEKV